MEEIRTDNTETLENALEQIKKLEKENAKLKEKLKPENCLKLLAKGGYVKFTNDQLIKAKELLNEFMRISKASDEDFEHDYSELIGEAEQFLQEASY